MRGAENPVRGGHHSERRPDEAFCRALDRDRDGTGAHSRLRGSDGNREGSARFGARSL